jgi:hypothetical protein
MRRTIIPEQGVMMKEILAASPAASPQCAKIEPQNNTETAGELQQK